MSGRLVRFWIGVDWSSRLSRFWRGFGLVGGSHCVLSVCGDRDRVLCGILAAARSPQPCRDAPDGAVEVGWLGVIVWDR